MSLTSRVRQFEKDLTRLGHNSALKAFDLMVSEMCSEKGFSRHNGEHYYIHLVDVAQDLLNHGVLYEPCIIAALLHDYMEDVKGVTFKTVEFMFNSEVANIVDLLTKRGHLDYKEEDNMKNYLFDIGNNVWASLIKTSDRKHNFSTLKDATIEKRMKQAVETETHFIPAFREWRERYPRYINFFLSASKSIKPHLDSIKELHDLHVKYNLLQENFNTLKG